MATAIGSNNSDIVLLTDVVRDQYVRYLERQLEENVCVWSSASRNHHKPSAWSCIEHSLKTLETRAIKACQAAQLYQRAMVKMIAAVRRNTQECRLADALFEHMQRQQIEQDNDYDDVEDVAMKSRQQFVDKSTQTAALIEGMPNGEGEHNEDDNYTSYTLCQKIDLFQSRLVEHETKQQQQQSELQVNGKQPMASPASSIEDTVSQELAKLFDDEPTDLNALFGIEIEANTDELKEFKETTTPQQKPTTSPDYTLPLPAHSNNQQVDLRHSRWPCELYAQRRRLNACLVRLLDADWRCEDALRYKFHMLFGEDSDDEFATEISSPSIDLVDEVLLASCILRIRPWIVHHLMRPLQEGLIANRFLFKKLAKMLANNIVLINPYSSERQVKQAVEQLFCIQPRGVQCELDLELLPSVFVERFES
ncbi:uncharacterized protein LOC117576385 [Drosophila albomicans]|uniref:Uncharacterized protein LOC117576385 n=1 Tax=Drosophila albomicans TaxID=7291 RepID=A0A6P8XUE0_DROAB|nr:uncharacterized protein LOC117576385 [Drosophila albomicans]